MTSTDCILFTHNDDEISVSKQWCDDQSLEHDAAPIPRRGSNLIDAVQSLVDKTTITNCEQFKLTPSVIKRQIPPVDILIFGRAGVGKSTLITAMTGIELPSSPNLDHVTQTISCTCINHGNITFRFWDTKGIDKWDSSSDIENMFNEIKEKHINPLFIIYCASMNGRVDSKIVTQILLQFKQNQVPIAYVITNIYAGDDEQFDGQRRGAFTIMNDVFLVKPIKISEYYYEYSSLYHPDGEIISEGKGILICVNSRPYIRKRGNINQSQLNVNELLDFIGNHLNGDRFAEFVILTLHNRSYWKQKYDYLLSRLQEISEYFCKFGIKLANTFLSLYA